MPHIHTNPGQHDQTASAFIVRTDGPEPQLMLHWHKKLHVWLQFGGHVELHENPWETVTHELLEESGYELGQLKLLQPKMRIKETSDSIMHPVALYDQTHTMPGAQPLHFHTDRGYGFFTDQEPLHKPQDGESVKFKLFSLDEIRALPPSDIPIDIYEIAEFLLAINLKDWDLVTL